MDNYSQVISFDSQKLWLENTESSIIVHKKSSVQEKDNLIKAKAFLANKNIKIGDTCYSIQVPDVYSWNSHINTLSMSYCSGENLELLLRNPNTRNSSIPFLQFMMRFILSQHFYWQDFAPRNIIIADNTIFFVDFEKGLNFSVDNLRSFFRNHVFEEYSSFLLPDERLISAEQIYSPSIEEKEKQIKLSDIKVKRIKYIAMALGYSDLIPFPEYLRIQSMIIKAEEPFIGNSGIVFPRIELVKMLENKMVDPSVYQKYASEVLFRNNLTLPNPNNRKKEEIEISH